MAVVMSRRQKAIMVGALETGVRDGFTQSVNRMKALGRANAVMAAIQTGDFENVIRAMGISEARYFLELAQSVRDAYWKAGQSFLDNFPLRVVDGAVWDATFNINNPRAERWLAELSSKKIRGQLLPEQRRAIRLTLEAGYARGAGPRSIALDLVGRIDRLSGRRTGGVIGLSRNMADYVLRARNELESGVASQMSRYMGRARRDARFDSTVQKAIAAGRPVAAADVDRILARYADRLVQLRGEMIARTETGRAAGQAAWESLAQAVEDGALKKEQVKRIWRSLDDDATRSSHLEMHGQEVGLDEPFHFPSGSSAMFPLDDSLGAPASEIIACRCYSEEDIDF